MFHIKQKIVILLSILMLLNFIVINAQPSTAAPSGYHWKLVWEDNFDGTTLDATKWTTNYHWGTIDALGGEVRYDNYIHPNHVIVHDGILSLKNSENLFPANYPNSNNGEYRLMNRANSKYVLPKDASITNGASIAQENYGLFFDNNGKITVKGQASHWKLQSLGSDTYLIKNSKSNLYLTNTANTISQATLVSNSDDQKWILSEVADGWYRIQNVASQLYLSQDGTSVTEAAYDESKVIQWKIFCKLQWIAGVVQNRNKISINRPGYVEASLKMPASTGTWPAFWLGANSGAWPPEVDILEYLSTAPSVVQNVHFKDASGANASSVKGDNTKVNPRDFDSKFRTFGVYMGATTFGALNEFHWYIDNAWNHGWWSSELYSQFSNLYAMLSAGNGGWAGLPDANSIFPNNYDIEWFRYWRLVANTAGNTCNTPIISPYSRINGGTLLTATTIKINSSDRVDLAPRPATGGTWNWSGYDFPNPNERLNTIYPTKTCIITVTYTDSCGGSTSMKLTIIVDGLPLSVETVSQDKDFSIYPNPANKTVNIRLPKFYENNSYITIVNSVGQTILSKTTNNESIQSIDISDLSSGVYFIKIINNEASLTKKFIKQ